MNANIKSLILLAATLVVGFSLGLFADATLVRGRRSRLDAIQRPPGFVEHMESVIQPHSDAQRDSIHAILQEQANHNDQIVRGSRVQLRAQLDSMQAKLAPMLDAAQRDRLAHEVERGPGPFGRGRGGPPFGRGGHRGPPPGRGGPPPN